MGGRSGMNQRMMHNSLHQSIFEGFKREMDRLSGMQPILIVQLNFEEFSYPIRRQILQMVILLLVFGLVAVGGLLSLLTLRGLKGSRLRLGKIEKELQRSERLAALGKMAAGVAHELRNPLSSIKGLALLLKSKSSDEGSSVETADILVQEVERLNRSIEELLDYAKPAKLNKISLDINVVVEKTIQLVAMDMQAQGISLDSYLTEGLPEIMIDEDKLNQVFLNLFLNGIQAMADGGILTVSSIRRGDAIAVVIEDTGSGVAESDLGRVFDPYFTTKNDGTGLGLAMSSKIVEEHEGKIILTSGPGKGTRVEVILPVVSG
jgi:two-component system sensor histidine kinase HydH